MRDDHAAEPGTLLLRIGDEVDAAHRAAVEASVATLTERAAEKSARAARRHRLRGELAGELDRARREGIEPDVDAMRSVREAADVEWAEVERAHPDWPTWVGQPRRPAADSPGIVDQVRTAPFDFEWEWHNGAPPRTSTVDRTTGQLDLAADAGEDQHVDAHAGVGIVLTTDHLRGVMGRCLRRTQHAYHVAVIGWGGSSTAEGGVELTVLEDGRLLTFAQDKRFRRRASHGEWFHEPFDGWSLGEGIEVLWVMQPGRVYTLNVGGWLFAETDSGVGVVTDNIARAWLQGQLITLNIFFD